MPTRPRILVVYGTRPEAIKVAPVIRALKSDTDLSVRVAVTGQHREMLDTVNAFFGIEPDLDLDIAMPGQTLTDITAAIVTGLAPLLNDDRPDLVLVHGDTTTSTAAAMAAYYARVPVAHLEAGLRSGDLASPWPEEGNRRLTAQLAEIQLAPTASAKANLLAENIQADSIIVTGNTVIDALLHTIAQPGHVTDPRINTAIESERKLVLLTGHRRESWDHGLASVARAIAAVIENRKDVVVVAPLHPNPIVRDAIVPALGGYDNVVLTEPVSYPDFCRIQNASHCIVTDSGGVQEEAPSLGKPVLVTRQTTERPEAIQAGAARLVGVDEANVTAELSALLDDAAHYGRMSRAINPYGDGHASQRAIAALKHYFCLGERLPDFA